MHYSRHKWLFFSLSLPIIFLLLYWLKLQVGINIFDTFSLGSRFPFKYLVNDVIEAPDSGILLDEDFEKKRLLLASALHLDINTKSTKTKYAENGFGFSRCLQVNQHGDGSWVSGHRKMVQVKSGDRFHMQGWVNLTGEALQAFLSVTAFDHEKNVIKWNAFKGGTQGTGRWLKIESQFEIPDDNIRYIRFRMVGKGKGIYRIDNIVFRKLN
jgi:hypothetical protein